MTKCKPVFHEGRWKQHRASLRRVTDTCADCGEWVQMAKVNLSGLSRQLDILPRRFKHREVNLGK